MSPTPFDLSRRTLTAHSADLRQFIDLRPVTLEDGQRAIDAHNSSGLTFTLLPDRGLDLYAAAFAGRPLTWLSAGSPHRADRGASFPESMNGGLLFTCGLRHVGPPEADGQGGSHPLHGDFTRLPARQIAISGAWEGERYVLTLRGELNEAALFRHQLRLTRTLRLTLGEPGFALEDVVENRDAAPAPLMVVYHYNFGYPTVQEGVRFYSPAQVVYPRDADAQSAAQDWPSYQAPIPNHPEEVFFHHAGVGADGWSGAVLAGDEFGVSLQWDAATLPYLTQWKNFRTTTYVCGVEPGNCLPEGQRAAQESGRLQMLAPGESVRFRTRFRVLANARAVARAITEVAAMREGNPSAMNTTGLGPAV